MAEVQTKARLVEFFGGPQPEGIAFNNLIETMFANGDYSSDQVLVADKIALVSDTAKTIKSLTLDPGEYDIEGTLAFVPAATTSITYLRASISLVADTDGAAILSRALPSAAVVPGATNIPIFDTPRVRVVITAPTVFYLVAHAIFTVSTLHGYGLIQARRVR